MRPGGPVSAEEAREARRFEQGVLVSEIVCVGQFDSGDNPGSRRVWWEFGQPDAFMDCTLRAC